MYIHYGIDEDGKPYYDVMVGETPGYLPEDVSVWRVPCFFTEEEFDKILDDIYGVY